MKIGDVSRWRRFSDPARQRWYAYHRSVRFARRMRRVLPLAGQAMPEGPRPSYPAMA